ncbi:hypothetical protein [Yersinia intermedia]
MFLQESILEWCYAIALVLACLGIWWVNVVRTEKRNGLLKQGF